MSLQIDLRPGFVPAGLWGDNMPVILISRGTMTGGKALAHCLADRLGLKCVSREDLVEVVDAHGEHAIKVMESLNRAARAYDQFSQNRRTYLILMRLALLEFIRQDNVVYHGYSGHLLVPSIPCCLKVRINGPMSLRVKNAMERLKLPEEEAREAVLKEGEDRVRWARFMYGRDIRDPNLYDVCFSLQRLSIEAICSMITSSLDVPELKPSPEARKIIDDTYLATDVEATLATHPDTKDLEVGARANDGSVLIEGPYLEEENLGRVKQIALGVPGVRALEYQPGCPSSLEFTPYSYS